MRWKKQRKLNLRNRKIGYMTAAFSKKPLVIIGLGNPEPRFMRTRHNIGFQIVDALAEAQSASWRTKQNAEVASIQFDGVRVLLMKPQTYMNNSGQVVPALKKEGFTVEDILVLHDELELPFGKLAFKCGGSAKGHNGLKSLIQAWGTDAFARFRFGIGRPEQREQVPEYVLQSFENPPAVQQQVDLSVQMIEDLYRSS